MSEFTAERRTLCESTPTPNASADTAPPSTAPLIGEPTSDAGSATVPSSAASLLSAATAPAFAPSQDKPSPPAAASHLTESTATRAATSEPDDSEDRALERRKHTANSLAETLLIALNIPYDDHAHEAEPIRATIEPPVTAAKVAAQIAQVSNALIAGTLDPDRAKPVLFALQTMLTAIRVNAIEQKANAQRTIEPARRARRSAPKCKTSKPRKTASSPSPRSRKSR